MKRSIVLVAATVALFGGPAVAQVTSGPLAEPAAVSVAVKHATTAAARPGRAQGHLAGRKHGKKTTSLPAKAAAGPVDAPDARDVPVSSADRRANPEMSDPISFGMKWNGANDNGEKTRVQNYDGNAQGTGAEVGMKLHF